MKNLCGCKEKKERVFNQFFNKYLYVGKLSRYQRPDTVVRCYMQHAHILTCINIATRCAYGATHHATQ